MKNRLYLRAFEFSDLDFINELRNDYELFKMTCGNKYYISSERDKKWIEDKIYNNYRQLYLIICCVESKIPIGYICATNIDYINRNAEYGGIFISKDSKDKGYATEASRLFLNHMFGELGMHMMYLYVKEDHIASQRVVEKLGYKKDGLVRDFVYKQNTFHNVYIYTILKSEYNNSLSN